MLLIFDFLQMDAFALTEGIVPESNHQHGHDNDKDSTSKLPEGANKFQRAIAAWRGRAPHPAFCPVYIRNLTNGHLNRH